MPDHRLQRERVHPVPDPVDVTARASPERSTARRQPSARPGCRSGARDGMSPTRPRPCFLPVDAWSEGGTVGAVLHTAQELPAHDDVEVVSLLRDAEHAPLPFGVPVRVLDDRTLFGALAPDDVVTVAQVHLAAVQQHPDPRRVLRRSSRRVDAVVVLSAGEQRDHQAVLRGSSTRLVRIPDAVPPLAGGPADPAAKVVVAVGRLPQQHGFDLLVLLVPPEDVAALTAALLTTVEDDELCVRCGRAARRPAEQHGAAQLVARRRAPYDELLPARDAADRAPRAVPALPAGRPAAVSQR